MNDATTERLELKVAFLERATTELSDVLYRQQQELQGMRLQLAALAARVDALKTDPSDYTADQERPPHY